MWLRRSKSSSRSRSQSRVHNALPVPSKFGSSSLKDAHTLLSDQCLPPSGDPDSSPTPILHRSRSSSNLLRTLSNPALLLSDPPHPAAAPAPTDRLPPGGEKCVIMYFTSLRVVRRTFEDCNAVRTLLQPFRVPIDERDISMDSQYAEELRTILDVTDISRVTLPRVFIGGRYVGGAEELRRIFESGELHRLMDTLPVVIPETCEACGGVKFVVCEECNGSHKWYNEKAGGFRTCTSCNENGLVRCPSCSSLL